MIPHMKPSCKIPCFFAAFLTLCALAGCRQREAEAPQPAGQTVRFHIRSIETKSVFGAPEGKTYPTLWTDNDKEISLSLNLEEALSATVEPAADGRSASFDAVIDARTTRAPYVFHAVSPASSVVRVGKSRAAWAVTIPTEQTPLEGSPEEAAQLLYASSASFGEFPEAVDIHFSHLTAYGCLTLKNFAPGESGQDHLEITSSVPFAGGWYAACTDGAMTPREASSTITLHTARQEDIWFACAPVDLSGATLRITVHAQDGTAVRKEVTFPQGRVLTGGKIARFAVDMADAEPVRSEDRIFRLVKETAVLKEGDELLVVNPDGTVAMSTNQKDKNRGSTAVTAKEEAIADPSEDVEVLTLVPGTVSGTWGLKTHDGLYLAPNGSKNTLKSSATLEEYGSWTISVASDGAATVKAGKGSYVYLLYNHGSSTNLLFSCYDSMNKTGMDPVRLYRRDDSPAVFSDDPVLAFTEYGAYTPDARFVFTQGKDQLSREYTASGTVFAILTPGDTALELAGIPAGAVLGDRFTLTVRRDEGFSVPLNKTYSVSVVKESGAKLWLSDGAGNGFIIKK